MKNILVTLLLSSLSVVCTAQKINYITNGDFETTPFDQTTHVFKSYQQENFPKDEWVSVGHPKATKCVFTAATDESDPKHNHYMQCEIAGINNPSWYGPLMAIHVSLDQPLEKGIYTLSFDAKSTQSGFQVASQIADYRNEKGSLQHYVLRNDLDVQDPSNVKQSAAVRYYKSHKTNEWETFRTEFNFNKVVNKYASIANGNPLEVTDIDDAFLKDFIIIIQLKSGADNLAIDNVKLTKGTKSDKNTKSGKKQK